MKKALIVVFAVVLFAWAVRGHFSSRETAKQQPPVQDAHRKEIAGTVAKGETLFDIFRKWKLDIGDLFKLREASAGIHRLREVRPGQPYKIVLDDSGLKSFQYWIDDDSLLSVNREESGFCAIRQTVDYEKRIYYFGGAITDNLIASMGSGRHNLMLALQLSDIYSWDIDFTTDIRRGDTFRMVVEAFYLNGEFRKYGDILAAEFVNDGETYRAYRFEHDGASGYYDDDGKSLRKAFLKAPLNFRRISSSFSRGRFHPILKVYRPHHGLDYAARAGTPVSAVGDGRVVFAGRKGQYGNIVIIRHPNGWKTCYGHLSSIAKGIRRWAKVEQGMVIGRVGSTGLATGPHLHYEVRINNRPVDPASLVLPGEDEVPAALIARFRDVKEKMYARLASIEVPLHAFSGGDRGEKT